MKDRPPPDSSDYTKWLKEKANLELTLAYARMCTPAYERHSIVSEIPSSLSLRRSLLSLFKNNVSRPFTLTDIRGLALWLDASDVSTIILSGSAVTQWNDKSGNSRHATTSGSPSYVSSSLNGLNGVRVSGASQSWTTPSFVLSPTSRLSAFVVAMGGTQEDNLANINLLQSDITYKNVCLYLRYSQPSAEYSDYVGGADANGFTGFKNTRNVPNIYELVYDSARASPYVNGTPYPTFSAPISGSALTSPQGLNAGNNGGNTFTQYEVLFFNTDLTGDQRQQIEGYLAWKWGLQASLPSNHPYFRASP